VKRAGFLCTMLAIPAFAQYGTRIGQVQTAYLIDIPMPPTPELPATGPARIGSPPEAARVAAGTPAAVTARAEFETWVEQRYRDYAESVVTGFTSIDRDAGSVTIRRFIRDNFRQTDLNYKMTLEAVSGTKTFRVVFSDSQVPTPLPQILREGETIILPLTSDARTGRRVVDYIRVGAGAMPPRQAVARDVYAEDAEMSMTKPRLRINGVEQRAEDLPDVMSAPVVWLNIPGQGRYLLSFKPRAEEGYEKAGEVAGNSLVFSSGGNIFRIDCADRIATGSGTYNIYARKDSAADTARFTIGAAAP
jgi:hypothetical protein